MPNRAVISIALFSALALSSAAPALAAGEILITQAKALAGNVTPGDAAGFPVTLSLPGAYEFASNILPTAGAVGIHANQRNITIDLNGFELHGGNIANHGIVGNQTGTTIRNGTITGFKFDGINGTGERWIVEDMRVVENGRDGVKVAEAFRILSSTITANGEQGIECGEGCHVEGNVVQENGGYGVSIFRGAVLGNTIIGNADRGIISTAGAGYGNNMLALNNQNMNQVFFVAPLEPNYCAPVACP